MTFPHGYALVIGVGTYRNVPQANVPITAADAQAIAALLADPQAAGYPADHITLLHDGAATRDGVLQALDLLAQQTKADDTVLLFYAGHGEFGTDRHYYLTTHDTGVDSTTGKVTAKTGLRDDELLTSLQRIRAERLLVIFNACHSGAAAPTSLGITPTLPDVTSSAILGTGAGRVLITACGRDEKSWFDPAAPTTIFTAALLGRLQDAAMPNRSGGISLYDLYPAVYDAVVAEVKQRYGSVQQPQLTVQQARGSFLVALHPAATDGPTSLDVPDQPVPTAGIVRQVSPQQSQQFFEQIQQGSVNLGQGNVNTITGDLTGGNKVGGDAVRHDNNKPQSTFNVSGPIKSGITNMGGVQTFEKEVTVDMGSTTTFSGNFQGAILNVRSQLQNVTQKISTLPAGDQTAKEQLTMLTTQLAELLQHVPPEQVGEAEKVSTRVGALVEEAGKPKPDKELIEFNSESLKKAASILAAVVPAVVPIATQIITHIMFLLH